METEILLYQISLVLAAKFTDKGMVSLRVVPKQSYVYFMVSEYASFPLRNSANMYLNGQKYDYQKWDQMQ